MWGRLLLSVMVVAVAAAHGQHKYRCPITVCPEIYKPVCGSDGITYSNPCYFARARCRDRTLRVVRHGPCVEECPKFCTLEYEPVCGTDGVTYGNRCELNAERICEGPANLAVKHEGRCQGPNCPTACTEEYDPVCGSDGVTYSNACKLRRAACTTNTHITQKHVGECRDQCPDVCIALYDPVCGSDGKTYSNSCHLEIAACNGADVYVVHEGRCGQRPY